MNSVTRRAIARIEVHAPDGRVLSRGTGGLVGPDLILTAMHVVADRRSEELRPLPGRIGVWLPDHAVIEATIQEGMFDRGCDWLLLRLAAPVPRRPLALATLGESKAAWEAFGFPDSNPQGVLFEGHVAFARGDYQGVDAVQLFSMQAAAGTGAPVPGLSGAPVLVDGAVVGVMRSSLMDQGRNVAGTLYACPLRLLTEQTAELLPLPDPLRGLPGLPRRPLPAEPFRYLEWYSEKDAEVFFGRSTQIRSLYTRATAPDAEPVVLFYGATGVGKSSLLAAGVLPRLRLHHEVDYVRRDPDLGLLRSLRHALGGDRQPDATLRELWIAREAAGRPQIVFLDQVEEVWTRRQRGDRELEQLLEEVARCFAEDGVRGRLVLAFRKEWLPDVETRCAEAGVGHEKMFLEPMGRAGIIDAISGLATSERLKTRYGLEVDERLPHLVADELTGTGDSPIAPTLQVLMTKLWRRAKDRSASNPRITEADYRAQRGEGVLLADFLDQQIGALGAEHDEARESGLVLDVLAFHTTPYGTANQRGLKEVRATYRHLEERVSALIVGLKDAYLLSESTLEDRDESAATRLAHDTLAPLIKRRVETSEAVAQQAKRILANRAGEWEAGSRGQPLDRHDLLIVERGRDGMRCLSTDEDRLIAASRVRRRTGRLVVGAIVAALVAASIALWSSRQDALRAFEEADNSAAAAQLARKAAERDRRAAVGAAQDAKDAQEQEKEKKQLARAQTLAAQSASIADSFPQRALLLAVEAHKIVADLRGPRLSEVENVLRIPRADSGRLVARHREAIAQLSVTGGGKRLLVAGERGSTAWRLPADESLQAPELVPTWRRVRKVLFATEGGGWAITRAPREETRLWRFAPDGTMAKSFPEASDAVGALLGGPERNGELATPKVVIWNTTKAWLWTRLTDKKPNVLDLPRPHRAEWSFAQEGDWLMAHPPDGGVWLWDVRTESPRPMTNLVKGHSLRDAVFRRDGSAILTVGWRGTVRSWGLPPYPVDGSEVRPGAKARSIAVSPSNDFLLVDHVGAGAELWEFAQPDARPVPLRIRRNPADPLPTFAFSPGGMYLATDSYEGTARLWPMARGARDHLLPGYKDGLAALEFSPRGRWVATVAERTVIQIWDLELDEPAAGMLELRGHDAVVTDLAFRTMERADGNEVTELLAGAADGTVRAWLLPRRKERRASVAFTDSGHLLSMKFGATKATKDDITELYRQRVRDDGTLEEAVRIGKQLGRVSRARVSPMGRWLAVSTEEEEGTKLLSLRSSNAMDQPMDLGLAADQLDFSHDGRFLVASAAGDGCRVWSLETLEGPPAPIRCGDPSSIAVEPDSTDLLLAGGYVSGLIRVKRINAGTGADDGAETIELEAHRGGVMAIEVAPGATLLASGDDTGAAFLWDLSSERPENSALALSGHDAALEGLVFSRDGRWLATDDAGDAVRLWRVEGWKGERLTPIVLRGLGRSIHNAVFSMDSKLLATASDDNMARMWDLSSTSIAATPVVIRGHTSPVMGVAFDPRDRFLCTTSSDGDVRTTPLMGDPLIRQACLQAGRALKHEELRLYFGKDRKRSVCEEYVRSGPPRQPVRAPQAVAPDKQKTPVSARVGATGEEVR